MKQILITVIACMFLIYACTKELTNDPAKQTQFYRLKHVNKDGTFKIYETIPIK